MATVSHYKFVRSDQIPENATVITDPHAMVYWAGDIERLIDAMVKELKLEIDDQRIEQLSVSVVKLIRESFSVIRTVLVKTEIELQF